MNRIKRFLRMLGLIAPPRPMTRDEQLVRMWDRIAAANERMQRDINKNFWEET